MFEGQPAGWRVLAVATLAVLAGCGGFSPGSGGEPTPTLTPAPVPGHTVDAPQGIAVDGLDGETVTRGHREALANRSHTVVETLRVGPAGNATFHQRTVRRVGDGGSPVRVDETIAAAGAQFPGRGTDAWWNGQRTVYRFTFASDRHTYYYGDDRPTGALRIDEGLPQLLSTIAVSDVGTGAGDTTLVEGYPRNGSALPRTPFLAGVENATGTVRVRETGVVDRIAIGYDARHGSHGRTHVRYTYRVTDVGTTTVRPPAWLQNTTLDAGE